MLTLFSYPGLFGLSDNNPYGLKIAAFLRLAKVPFRQEHLFNASGAPRGQLPYIVDDSEVIGDSGAIIDHVTLKYGVAIDRALAPAQTDLGLLVDRMLDDLYWVMSYSRWRDPRFWPQFRDAVLTTHKSVTAGELEAARAYNFERYRAQGIGRCEPDAAYARGIADLGVLADLIGPKDFLFEGGPHAIDAAVFGFLANIYYFEIETPLKETLRSKPALVRHCKLVRALAAP